MSDYFDPGSDRRFRVARVGRGYTAFEGRRGVDKPSLYPTTLGHYDTAGDAEDAIRATCPAALPLGVEPSFDDDDFEAVGEDHPDRAGLSGATWTRSDGEDE